MNSEELYQRLTTPRHCPETLFVLIGNAHSAREWRYQYPHIPTRKIRVATYWYQLQGLGRHFKIIRLYGASDTHGVHLLTEKEGRCTLCMRVRPEEYQG